MILGEVIACRVPIVAYDLPVYKKIFKKAIEVVPLHRIDLFSEAVLKLLTLAKKKTPIVPSTYSIIKDFSWDKSAEKEEKIIIKA